MFKFIFLLVLFIAVYLYLIMPKILNKQDLSPFMGRYYAHRGLHQEKNISPENSLAAFQLAVDHHYGIELDVHLTKDHIPIVFHDDNLKRVCGLNRQVNEMNFDELRTLTLYDSNEKIPHLQEVLDLVNGKVPLIVELKAYKNVALSCEIISSYLDQYKGIYCIESFNPMAVLWYKRNRPGVVRGQLATRRIYSKPSLRGKILNFTLRNLMYNYLTKPDFIAYDQRFSHLISYNLCKTLYNPLTIAYTIQSQDVLNKKHNKFDLFIFDNFIPKEII